MAKQSIDISKAIRAINKKQATINRASRKLKNSPKYIRVGWDSKSGKYPEQDGTPVEYVAHIHDKGLGPHEAKHMLDNTKFLHAKEWAKLYKKLARKAMRKTNSTDFYDVSEIIGERMKEDLKNYVYDINLVDTTRLANSIIVRYSRR